MSVRWKTARNCLDVSLIKRRKCDTIAPGSVNINKKQLNIVSALHRDCNKISQAMLVYKVRANMWRTIPSVNNGTQQVLPQCLPEFWSVFILRRY